MECEIKKENVGIVIGTFAAVPYVHLSLEALRRNEPNLKILVHDDCSPFQDKLKEICDLYGASFYSLNYRRNPVIGDMSSVLQSIIWSNSNNCEIGIKMSRRYIINRPFVSELCSIMSNMQVPTVSSACSTWGFGFRSEFIGFHVPTWNSSSVINDMKKIIEDNKAPELLTRLPEAWYHNQVKEVYSKNISNERKNYDRNYPLAQNRAGFADMPMMGLGRNIKVPNIIWHDSSDHVEYYELSKKFNLPYTLENFKDPNMGHNNKP